MTTVDGISATPVIIRRVSLNHPDLTRFVNGVLAQAIADGSWNRLAHTCSPDSPHPPPPTATNPAHLPRYGPGRVSQT
ncbi:hypothetical protein MXD62_14205 [Frankia sp. Mgl5]|uniref:hypothetical protein n=1 Tax=Frankia sp. Mgl5 TaxID=2933793 RepID=UPI00200CBB85|nr:hypothetical protein [Frankia sp. Mgl5]MCK9928312.1 hypothetical protein [Frankia sp. Mgl5]